MRLAIVARQHFARICWKPSSLLRSCPSRESVSILSQVTENSAIEFVVLRSETVFTAVLASVSINYRSTWVCAKLVSVVFQLQLISLPLNQNIETTTQMCFVYFSWVMQLGDLWFCVTRREFNSVRYFFLLLHTKLKSQTKVPVALMRWRITRPGNV